jgi:hypothetical protein
MQVQNVTDAKALYGFGRDFFRHPLDISVIQISLVQFRDTFFFGSKCRGKVEKSCFAKDYFACLFTLRNNANSNGKEHGSGFLKK